jgi:D-beta-D-heptose 7-phosphate kinase/D-beta-D-heptose 1-phosphate adenosyltransferase
LLAQIYEAFDRGVDAVILSDYAKGALPEEVCQVVIRHARSLGVPVLVDPKGRDFRKYHGATTLTPNRGEFNTASALASHDDAGFVEAAQRLLEELALDFLVVTQGEQGISLLDDRGCHHYPALAREVFDVSGAGDTVIALLTAGIVARLDFSEALHLANLAAGVVVGKVGTVPVRTDELLDAIDAEQAIERSGKIADLPTLLRRVARWRAKGESVVFTNGCFDLLHAGHIKLLERARAEGSRLIIGLNSDSSVRELKGSTRPVIPEGDRMQVLAALGCVDAVILFEEETPLRLIEAIRPDVLVKGGDYADHQVVGGDVVKANGGKVVLIPLVEGRSTTRIVSKLKITAGV